MPAPSQIMGGIILALAVALSLLFMHCRTLNATIKADKIEIATLMAANSAFKSAVDNQNKAIDELKAKDILDAKRAAAAIALAKGSADKHRKNAENIKNQVVNGDDCQSANLLLTEYMRGTGL